MPERPAADAPLDLLAIGAHPDDVDISCGGTLAVAASQGYSTGFLDLTRGEMGTNGTPEMIPVIGSTDNPVGNGVAV